MTKVFITGAAGLVGQNLTASLKSNTELEIVAADKHAPNLAVLRQLHPEIEIIETDLAEADPWEDALRECEYAIFLHAQIGGLDEDEFVRNNVKATGRCLEAMKDGRTQYLVHSPEVSSGPGEVQPSVPSVQASGDGQLSCFGVNGNPGGYNHGPNSSNAGRTAP